MLGIVLIAAALAASGPELLDRALARFDALQSYRVTVHSTHADGEQHLRYFYRKPGHVRMEFIRPHAGAVLVYDPATQRAHLWPFGASHFPELNLDPGNPLITSPRGQRVDHSDVGALLGNVNQLAQQGRVTVYDEAPLGAQPALLVEVTGQNDAVVAGVHRYKLWLDPRTLFPLKVVSHDRQDALLETVLMDDAELDPALPASLFAPEP